MRRYGLSPAWHFEVVVVCVLVSLFAGLCHAVPSVVKENYADATDPVDRQTTSNLTTLRVTKTEDCSLYRSSCQNCSQHLRCAWCFSEKSCLPEELREQRGSCDEDDWYYGDCDKPEKETVLVYVLLGCALFLLLIVILLVLYIFFCKLPRNNDYEPVSTNDKKTKRKRTPLMSKKVKRTGSRTDELKKKYQLDG